MYVVATSPSTGGAIYYKRSPLDDVSFETGLGTLLIGSEEDPRISNATSTKQALTPGRVSWSSRPTTRPRSIAWRPEDVRSASRRPCHRCLPMRRRSWSMTRSTAGPTGQLPAGWTGRDVGEGRSDGPAPRRPRRGGPGRQLWGGPPPRVCRGFVPITAGHVRIAFDAMARGSGRTEPVLALIRGDGRRRGIVSFGSRGTFGFFDGASAGGQSTLAGGRASGTRSPSTSMWPSGRWRCRSPTMAGNRPAPARGRGLPGSATTIDEICFQPAAGADGHHWNSTSVVVARMAAAD